MKKKICLITGGNGFLGKEFCKYFASINYNVISVDKSYTKKIYSKVSKNNIKKYKCDITNESEVKNLSKELINYNFDLLINNAAIDAVPHISKKSDLKYPSLTSWKNEIDVSIIGSFLMIKYFGEKMFKKRSGSIINIGSDLSILAPNQNIYKKTYRNYKKPPTYSVIKHGLVGLTKYYSSLYGERNVRVNMVSPGPVQNKQGSFLIKEIKKLTPMNKMNNPKNIFGILSFLAGDQSSFITGQNILVDGGKSII